MHVAKSMHEFITAAKPIWFELINWILQGSLGFYFLFLKKDIFV